MVKAVPASESHDTETEKSQNHLLHSTNGEKNDGDNIMTDVFRWSRCKKPLPQKVMRSIGIPLPPEHVEVLHLTCFFRHHRMFRTKTNGGSSLELGSTPELPETLY